MVCIAKAHRMTNPMTNRETAIREARIAYHTAQETYGNAALAKAGMTDDSDGSGYVWDDAMKRFDRSKAGKALLAAITAAHALPFDEPIAPVVEADTMTKHNPDALFYCTGCGIWHGSHGSHIPDTSPARDAVDTTTNTEPCYTCGRDFNCPDCGVWLDRAEYEDAKRWAIDNGAGAPALTRILSEEAAPADAGASHPLPKAPSSNIGDWVKTATGRSGNTYTITPNHAPDIQATPVDAPAPTDPRGAEIEALKAEVAALRDALLNSKPYITVKDMADGFNAVQAVVYKNDYAYTTEYWDGKSSDAGVADAVRLWVQRWAVEFDIPAARIFDTRTNSTPVES